MKRSIVCPSFLVSAVSVFFFIAAPKHVSAFLLVRSPVNNIATSSKCLRPTVLLYSSETTTSSFDQYSLEDPDQDLAYQDTRLGTGDVAADDGLLVTVAYKGSLLSNGKVFDEGPGISFRLGDGTVIPGWERGIIGMKVGGKRTLKIPPNLAYGDQGAGGGVIPPNAHLIFECELKGIATSPTEEVLVQVKNLPPLTIVAIVVVLGNFLLLAAPQ
ncbi:FK506-binding [Seminavis robusta]|uniref:peptidylprolyl isomerase n=1 Tax=Seminavis robusta TaxID=568900 RepID=A0A9N8DQ28_9STRA|nr:FK506-binding [Seminavis robusta]|eukprot:Sro207_g086970.1 FK506-binding (215) ;mRNA; r:81248-81892